jgi:integrase
MSGKRANGEGTIYRRGDGRYTAQLSYRDDAGKLQRRTFYGKTQADVRAKLKEARGRVDAGAPAKDSTITLRDYAEAWITSTLAASDRKPSTRELYSILARTYIAKSALGATTLGKIRPSDVERFVLELGDHKAASTVRQTYTVLRAILDAAVRDQLLASNPAAKVQRPGVPRQEVQWITPEELETLLAMRPEDDRLGVVFRLLAWTGLRRGEALALRWQDVDLTKGILRVSRTLGRVEGKLQVSQPKTAKSRRSVPLSAPVAAMLAAHRERQRFERHAAGSAYQDLDLVFATEVGGYLDPRNTLRALTTAVRKAGLPEGVGLHTLRHCAASAMLAKGAPVKVVSEILGHSSIAITGDVYGHVSTEDARSALDLLTASSGRP